MVNRRAKGYRNERKVKADLEEKGFKVERAVMAGRFKQDMFGVVDLIAIKDGKIYFVQVKSNNPYPDKKYKEFTEEFDVPLIYANWVDYQGPEYQLIEKGECTEYEPW